MGFISANDLMIKERVCNLTLNAVKEVFVGDNICEIDQLNSGTLTANDLENKIFLAEIRPI